MTIFNKKYTKDLIWLFYIGIVFLALDGFYAKDRFIGIGANMEHPKEVLTLADRARQAIFIFEYLTSFFIIYTCTKIKKYYAIPLLIIIWILTIIDLNFHNISGKPAAVTNIAVLNAAIGNVQDAMMEYADIFIKNIALSLLLFVPLLIGLFKNKTNLNVLFFVFPTTLLATMYLVILLIRGEPALIGFPKGFSYGFGSFSLKVNDLLNSFKKKEYLQTKKISDGQFNKIIVVIDESINYPEFVAFKPDSHQEVVSYGKAFSAANCSAASNFILRRAGWIKNSQDGNLNIIETDSLFDIAHKSNYKTVYIDNQNVLNDPSVNNYFDPTEIAKIDTIIPGEGDDYTRDLLSIKKITEALQQPKVFIFINKMGAHFPYQHTIPPEYRTNEKLKNYNKSLEINSINFIDQLISNIDDETLVFYTSDHGQNLTSDMTHCNIGDDIVDSEYAVPFMLITKNESFRQSLLVKKDNYTNKLNHLNFSESIRNIMGYSIDGISSIFKDTIVHQNHYCGVFGPPKPIFGIQPKCHTVGG